jgi:hypothetical protein
MDNIPLHVYNMFIHSSVDRHLDCFYLLATVNNFVILYKYLFESLLWIIWDIYLGVELCGNFTFNFYETQTSFMYKL